YYEVCYDATQDGNCNGSWQNVGTALSTTISGLAANTLHEWQVRACNAVGCTGADGGAWWTFTTASGPAPFSKLTPAPGAQNQPT
ncbi:MAG: hypothetical protein RML84_11595, partial [Anaerolineae bacterium]|nr:hypothetical protein [Anaerolineae bacterium]